MNHCTKEALREMAESNNGCLFARDAGDTARDGLRDAVAQGYATGPHRSAWDSPHGPGPVGYYEITPKGRAAYAAATRR